MPETPLQLILEANVKKGHENTLRELAKSGSAKIEKSEPGTLEYRWVIDDEGTKVRFLDTYANSKAFVDHIHTAQSTGFMDELMGCVDITAAHVVGNPNPEARKILDGFHAQYFHNLGGFNRMQATAPMTASR